MQNNGMYIRTGIKATISILLVWFVLSMIHVSVVIDVFSRLDFFVYVMIIVLYCVYLCIGAYKWNILLPEHSFKKLLRFTFVGQFYGLILPGQITGELAKGYRFARESGEGSRIAASIMVDKITAFGALIFLGVVGSIFATYKPPLFAVVIIGFFALVLSCFLYAARYTSFVMKIMKCCHCPKYVMVKIGQFLASYKLFATSQQVLTQSVFLGIISQCIAISMNAVIAYAIGIHIGLYEWLWLFAVTSFVTLLPITIGGLGVRETVFAASALSLGTRPSLVVALSLMMYGLQVLFAVIGGLLEWISFIKGKK